MIEILDVSFTYPRMKPYTLHNIRFLCKKGEVVGIIGPNGAGKTTLLKIIGGIIRPDRGCVTIDDVPLNRLKTREIAMKIAFVPSSLKIDMPITVYDTVSLGRNPHRKGFFFSSVDHQIVCDALRFVGVQDLAERPFSFLSAGEQKKVLIAKGLAQQTDILLLDEPTANLDVCVAINLFERLLKAYEEKTIFAVVHDINIALMFCTKLIMMRNGEVFIIGTPEEVCNREILWDVFGCDFYIDKNPMNGKLFIIPHL